jgi:hypothetical protein
VSEPKQRRTVQVIFKATPREGDLLKRGATMARSKFSPWARGVLLREALALAAEQVQESDAAPTTQR